ncbi:MAG: LytTR family DNA-binding domain-containing protein [Lachnospiraceae bacterium]|nr:LytTR family DNA-binding domain-containing protein [Lachnospiraceae bacterium]
MEDQIVIGICDDNPMAVQQLGKMIEEYLKKEDTEAGILTFNSGIEVLEALKKPDILFLDIEMPGEDGIETGKRLREQGSDCRIIMATSMVERFKEGYHIGAVRFITKPFEEEEVWEALNHALQGLVGRETIELYEKRILHKVEKRQIHYIQAYDGYAEAVVGRNAVRMRTEQSLSSLENELNGQFFYRVSREYLVNLTFIEAYNKGTILIGEQKIRVSRRKKKEFEKAYREYDLNFRS